MVPRSVVIGIVIVLTLLLTADVAGQFVPGLSHEASPVLDGALLAILGSVIAGSKGPKPDPPPDPDTPSESGRHRTPQDRT